MRKDINYKYFKSLIKDKDKSIKNILENTLNKTQSMFYWENLPSLIDSSVLEHDLQTNGNVFVTKIDNEIYALKGNLCGELDINEQYTKYMISNQFITKEFDIKKDGVLIKNDYFSNGLVDIIGKNAALLTDANISLNTCAVLTRLTYLLSASDDKTKQSAEIFMQKILDGDYSIIATNPFLDTLNLQSIPTANNSNINNLIELVQYYKSNLLSEIGLNSNFNLKRERLNEAEVLLNVDDLLPFVETMLNERKKAVKKLNEMFDLDVKVDLLSVWKANKENNDKTINNLDSETDLEENTEENTEENKEVETDLEENKDENKDTENKEEDKK